MDLAKRQAYEFVDQATEWHLRYTGRLNQSLQPLIPAAPAPAETA
jgi:hypothetical protein